MNVKFRDKLAARIFERAAVQKLGNVSGTAQDRDMMSLAVQAVQAADIFVYIAKDRDIKEPTP